MSQTASLSPVIVESLYEEALLLSDEARAIFDFAAAPDGLEPGEGAARIALSCEALRTTTRMMHALAWLLNQRAYLAGDLSEFQLRRHGRLPPAQGDADPQQMALLDLETLRLVHRTHAFYERVARLDRAWRANYEMQPSAVERLRHRLDRAFATG